ncbi:MAG: alpha-mannosidase, partial [Candidatus Marinimicrobia bacterium]|nr:alpha-mannosidase [Candidatus Neomarinimicrobiota bacterium]
MAKPRVHLICNAHLDPVWQWRWEEGCSETLATFRNAVDLIHEHGSFIFNHNEAVLYAWVHKYDPELFREIQSLVKKERWAVSGGWYLQPDVNLPGTESIIRQIITGRRFFKDYFGADPRVAYNFDSFGHSGGLPQILKAAGYEMYIHMRPLERELKLPANLYRWQGVDGSEVLAMRPSTGFYHSEPCDIREKIIKGIEQALELRRDTAVFWGLGDHGGGATRKDLETIDCLIADEDRVEIIHSTTDQLYGCLQVYAPQAPVVKGDLQRCFTGCYTSLSRIKRGARQSLGRLIQTEALQAAVWWQLGRAFPHKELEEAWRDHLFNDFHDILPGSCTEPAEADALSLYGQVAEITRRLRLGATVAYNHQTGPEQAYLPVTVLNANPNARRVPVEVECMFDYRPPLDSENHLRLFRPDGEEIICQEEQPEALLPFGNWRRKVSFIDTLPGLGAAYYRLKPFSGAPQSARKDFIPALKHTLDPNTGLISALYSGGRQVLSGYLPEPLVVNDDGDSWGTDRWQYRDLVGRFIADLKLTRVIKQGSVRQITESILTYHQSRIILHTIAYQDWPVLEFKLRIHWNEERKMLKLAFPTVLAQGDLTCEVPGGAIIRPGDGQEHVHGRWASITDKINSQPIAIAIVNNGQHGLDFHDGELRLSVLRSPAYCHEQGLKLSASPARKYMDQGVHEVRFLVTIGEPSVVCESLAGLADWLDSPPVAYAHFPVGSLAKKGPPPLEPQPSLTDLISINPSHVRLCACKAAQDGKGLILRLQETVGSETETKIVMNVPKLEMNLTLRPF